MDAAQLVLGHEAFSEIAAKSGEAAKNAWIEPGTTPAASVLGTFLQEKFLMVSMFCEGAA